MFTCITYCRFKKRNNSISIPKTYDILLSLDQITSLSLLAVAVPWRPCWTGGRNLSQGLKEAEGSHLFPVQNVPSGQSYRRCGTGDGFVFQRKTASELFLRSHVETWGADECGREGDMEETGSCSCRWRLMRVAMQGASTPDVPRVKVRKHRDNIWTHKHMHRAL